MIANFMQRMCSMGLSVTLAACKNYDAEIRTQKGRILGARFHN
jgi:hypothetical protein